MSEVDFLDILKKAPRKAMGSAVSRKREPLGRASGFALARTMVQCRNLHHAKGQV